MTTPRLRRLAPVAALCLLAACGGPTDPGAPSSPSTATASPLPSGSPMGASAAPADPTPTPTSASAAPDSDGSPSASEPGATDAIPAAIHGRWITAGKGEAPRECTAELDAQGAIITIDATSMSAFAFVFELEAIEESGPDSMVGTFTYADDSDQLITPRIRLETTDGWQSLEFIELDTQSQDPAHYSRCA